MFSYRHEGDLSAKDVLNTLLCIRRMPQLVLANAPGQVL